MKIAFASDHAGFNAKKELMTFAEDFGYQVVDFGTHSTDSCDYPDFVYPAAKAVAQEECEKGIFICSTGIGVSICANKVKGIRCALCTDVFQAEMTRRHNNSNCLAMGANVTTLEIMKRITAVFLETGFEGGRHLRRVEKMMAIEDEQNGKTE